jgi:cytochrome oxidase Cu insertion factor (SCO1/SenC/PrrC family)
MKTGVLCLRVAVLLSLVTTTPSRANHSENSDNAFDAPTPGTYQLPVIKPAADGGLVDASGNTLRLSGITGGKITVLSFIYTRCGDAKACPYAASVLNHLQRASAEDAELARNLRLVSMSFDPEHDTPERLAEYASIVRDDNGGCEWRFVAPRTTAETAPILAAYGQAVNKRTDARSGGGPFNHTLRVYLIDRERRIRNIYSSGTLDPRLVLADIRTLLLEQKADVAAAAGLLP